MVPVCEFPGPRAQHTVMLFHHVTSALARRTLVVYAATPNRRALDYNSAILPHFKNRILAIIALRVCRRQDRIRSHTLPSTRLVRKMLVYNPPCVALSGKAMIANSLPLLCIRILSPQASHSRYGFLWRVLGLPGLPPWFLFLPFLSNSQPGHSGLAPFNSHSVCADLELAGQSKIKRTAIMTPGSETSV